MKLFRQPAATNKKSGFALIELLIVLVIFFLLAFLIVPNLNFFRKQSTLNFATEDIIGVLRLAQNKTLASEGASVFGVYFETDKYTLFKGGAFVAGAPDNEAHSLPSEVIISEINLDGGPATVFNRLTGITSNDGSLKIELTGDASQNKTIIIDSSGAIGTTETTADDSNRLKDSRHVHIFYAQNAKTAVNLTLFFPTDALTQTINFQEYFNTAKTEFNWEGVVTVNNVEQKLKIHTHEFTDGAALFCVHRDLRYNSQALDISLDGQNLINYAANGVTTQGTSLWAGAPEEQ
jgi:type II secretory pathway pseudopilin PulG